MWTENCRHHMHYSLQLGHPASVSLPATRCCQDSLIDTNWCHKGLANRRHSLLSSRSLLVTNAAPKCLWQTGILQDPSRCV